MILRLCYRPKHENIWNGNILNEEIKVMIEILLNDFDEFIMYYTIQRVYYKNEFNE